MANEVELQPDEVHNPPQQSSTNREDQTPIVSPTQIDTSEVPEYQRPIAAATTLKPGDLSGSIAHSYNDDTHQVTVDMPDQYTAAVQAHELTHLAQHASGQQNVADPSSILNAKDNATRDSEYQRIYGYGGTEGLANLMQSPKGISSLNDEQQASIPSNYMKEYQKAVKSGDAKAVDRVNQVYQPAIKQLRNMVNPSKDKIDTTPDAPAAPPASLTGEAVPVKGMLSKNTKSSPIDSKASKWYNAASALGQRRK